jgi:predicted CopG family antitoxin
VETKSIRVSKKTYDRLSKLGDLSDSFDTVLTKLMDQNMRYQSFLKKSEKIIKKHEEKLGEIKID